MNSQISATREFFDFWYPYPTLTATGSASGVFDRFERRALFAGGFLEPFAECIAVVGDEFGTVAGAADLDVEALLCGQMRAICLHRRDDGIDGATLEGADGGDPSAVGVAEPRVALVQGEGAPVIQPERKRVIYAAVDRSPHDVMKNGPATAPFPR